MTLICEWLIILACAGGAEWVAARFDKGLSAVGRRRAHRGAHRAEVRRLELEAKARKLEAVYPRPVEPTCGCGHDLAFHSIATDTCHHVEDEATCPCQRYTGPEPLTQLFLPPLSDPEQGTT